MGSLAVYGLLFISLYFEMFLLVSYIERRLRAPKTRLISPLELPRVAVVVPCFNEGTTIEGTVRSLLALSYPKEKLEILIVDDGSTDNTMAIAEGFKNEPQVRIYHKENGGKHTAMNVGLAHTDAELIDCLDADSIVSPDALMRIAPLFADQRIAAVTPGIHVKEPKNLLQHMQNVEYRLSLFNRYITAALGAVFITPGPFSIFRASAVKELGGWRYGHSTEDMEMALRMQNAGYWIANAPAATVHTSTPFTFKHLYRQRVRWTYGWLRNAIDYRHMIGSPRFGNLGLIVLPTAIFSIGAGIFFFARIAWGMLDILRSEVLTIYFSRHLPHFTFDLYYVNTSAMMFLVFISIALILLLICVGTYIGTGRKTPPLSTPLFLFFYSFFVPLWLFAAVVRATFKTGVRWR